jgi:hypothetical protein
MVKDRGEGTRADRSMRISCRPFVGVPVRQHPGVNRRKPAGQMQPQGAARPFSILRFPNSERLSGGSAGSGVRGMDRAALLRHILEGAIGAFVLAGIGSLAMLAII